MFLTQISIPSPTPFFSIKTEEEKMANHGCIDGQIVDTGFSSPVPVIGLYIAAASLLCVLLMLFDIVAGFHARKRWLPCKLFTLNSVTLTLFSIAAKLPVDLTSPMPSSSDQLSKLSGTTFICISMCFLMPSLGVHPASESFTNMVALTIFVITVFVNICMQLSTGVIALFRAEHIFILCSLLVLLLIMWHTYWEITYAKKVPTEKSKEIFTKGDGSMSQRLMDSYSYGYTINPQLVASLSVSISVSSMTLCTLCCITLIQATYRSVIRKELEFCSGNSDYDGSIPLILVTQTLTVIIGSSAVIFRCSTMFKYLTGRIFTNPVDKEVDDVIQRNPILGITSRLDKYGRIVRYAFLSTMSWLEDIIGILFTVIIATFRVSTNAEVHAAYGEWLHRKSHENVERWINLSKSEPSSHLSQLLISAQNYPYHQFDTMEVIDPSLPSQKGVYVSSLSILLLVRIAQVSLPENRSISLVKAFNEAKEVFYYTEKNITQKSWKNDYKLLFAKSVWAGQEFSCLLPRISILNASHPSQSDLHRGLSIIRQLKTILPSDPVWDELGIIVDFIDRKTYSTVQELTTSVEQLFVDMVRVMLSQIPQAIFKSLNNSIDEEYEENVKLALKILCKVESFEGHIQWSFPPGCNFTSLANTEAPPLLDAISQV